LTSKSNKTAISDHFEIILDSIADGVFTVDMNWNVTAFNKAAEKITGFTKDIALKSKCFEIFRTNICEGDCALRKTITSKKNITNKKRLNIL